MYFSLIIRTATIKAFEADPDIARILKENLQKNNIKNVEVLNQAVWINDDSIEMSFDGLDGASIINKNNLTKVPSIRLKDLIEKELKIDMLKIDIEGAEYEVLKDCAKFLK